MAMIQMRTNASKDLRRLCANSARYRHLVPFLDQIILFDANRVCPDERRVKALSSLPQSMTAVLAHRKRQAVRS